MTLPLFLVDPDRLVAAAPGATLLLDGPEGRHAATVRRIGVGERVLLADAAGRCAEAVVTETARDSLTLEVHSVREEPEPTPRFVLVQALAKGDRDDQAVEAATELGVDEIVPWQASRSIVVWRGERAVKAQRKWESTVLAATKQSRRFRAPTVSSLVTTADLCRRVRGEGRRGIPVVFVLHEEASEPLAGQPLPDDGDVLVVVGPEGGIAPEELEGLVAAGGRPVRLGGTVLRSSSAGPAALAVLSAAVRWR